MENEELPQYMRIAVSVAGRIAEGQFAEGEKLSGRSKLSSEYQVSPETIRKAVQLLRDMQVVSVKEQSGIYVRSAGNARRYLQMVGGKIELRQKKQRLRALLAQQEAVARQVSELCGSILDDSIQPVPSSEQLQSFSCRIPQDWPDSGKSLGSLHFWQATGATVVAIGRAEALSVSPGPYAELCGGDLVIFVGDSEAREAVAQFFKTT
jgi:K+/H+ antiporter YhaU regulatory subunit KhtT